MAHANICFIGALLGPVLSSVSAAASSMAYASRLLK